MKNFFVDFGFKDSEVKDPNSIALGPKRKRNEWWTLFIYIFFSLGIFFRRTVATLDPLPGVNVAVFTWSVMAASFIIGLALLAPLLRVISKYHKGKLSWQHCLTAFSMGFFGNLTFEALTKGFIKVL